MQIGFIQNNVFNALGPGTRLCIWTLGCYKNCYKCISPEFQFGNPEMDIDIVSVLGKMDLSKDTGVTISGGEPFLDSFELQKLVDFLSKRFDDILIYSGYTEKEIRMLPEGNYILSKIAVLVDGPYIDSLNNGEKLRGSTNQNIIVYKEKYKDLYEKYNKEERNPIKIFSEYYGIGYLGIPKKK